MLDILNLRLGFANNSSSSHSIVFLENNAGVQSNESNGSFGWGFFTAASPEAKSDYLIASVFDKLSHTVGDSMTSIIMSHLLNRSEESLQDTEWYVDHQSQLVFPRDFHKNIIDMQYFNDLREFLMQDGIAVLGGNDNSDECHPLLQRAHKFSLPTDEYGVWVARKDGDVWVFFNQNTGNKIRFSFKKDVEYNKSSLPELVDIKITDFCPYNCPFCYQNSTAVGKHASMYTISNCAQMLSERKVFEVAIGGGEPTLHPEFVNILKIFRSKNVIPNFTTRNLQWLRSEHKNDILNFSGSFAVSTEKTEDIIKLSNALSYHEVPKSKASLQFVVGATDEWTFRQLIETAIEHKLSYTLLGYKSTGRGDEFQPKITAEQCWDIIQKLKSKHSYMRVGIDTVLAEQLQSKLSQSVDRMFYHTRDGVFSCYIDAVQCKMAPSSYCNPSQYVELKLGLHNNFDGTYRSFA